MLEFFLLLRSRLGFCGLVYFLSTSFKRVTGYVWPGGTGGVKGFGSVCCVFVDGKATLEWQDETPRQPRKARLSGTVKTELWTSR